MTNEDNQAVESLALVNHALYDTIAGIREPYGLEGSDGVQEERHRCSSALSPNVNAGQKSAPVTSKT